jgi:hypothetical protein
MVPTKLKYGEVAGVRKDALAAQSNRCAICSLEIVKNPVLDHDHTTGAIRSALHSGCNSLLGKIENNYRRFGVVNLEAFLHGVPAYLQYHSTAPVVMIHPTFKPVGTPRAKKTG